MSEADMQRIADDGEPAAAGRSFAERLVGAFRLDESVYEEVANDPARAGARGRRRGVCRGCARNRDRFVRDTDAGGDRVGLRVSASGCSPPRWSGRWATLLRHPGDFGRVLRAVGFAMSPLILVALVLVPNDWVRAGVMLVTYALLFGALVVAVRPALRIDTGRAAFVCILVALIVFLIYSAAMFASAPDGWHFVIRAWRGRDRVLSSTLCSRRCVWTLSTSACAPNARRIPTV